MKSNTSTANPRAASPGRALLALLTVATLLTLVPTRASATELALRPNSVSLSAGSERAEIFYARGSELRFGWVGARYLHRVAGLGLPIGVSQEIWAQAGRPLQLRAELTPMVLTGDHLTPGLGATLGLDQRFIGRTLLGSLGLEVDYAAQAPLERFEQRANLLLTSGVGHRFGGMDLWLTARAGYTLGGQGGGGLIASMSLGATFGRFTR